MKTALALTALCLVALTSHATPTGTVEASTAYAHLTEPYEPAHLTAVSMLADMGEGRKLGAAFTGMKAWGQSASFGSLRAVVPLSADTWVDASVGISDRGSIAPRYRVGAVFNKKWPQHNIIAGVGLDSVAMRGGTRADTFRAQGVYYAQSVPVVVQADWAYSNALFNNRGSDRLGVAATYGNQGNWTVTARVDSGAVHYELLNAPGAVADYTSTSLGVSGRYWVSPDWGVLTGVHHVNNDYYIRNELRAGVFWKF